ncbi:PHB depolymerase family esterase [Mesorhizobium sp. M0045]|uniref:extracellular catalytic domain type 1 short-chain-length polyhydroxyalkanoate depolymerase n=1 Tax=Mesorhizobium sp. M0045 TaxID=2956857 RepID=UPI00333765DF
MRKISDTIAKLAALRARHATLTADLRASDDLQTLTDFGDDPGALGAKFYIPNDVSTVASLVVVLHGCTQNAAGYNHHSGWSQLADEAGFALLFPEQQRGNNPNLCFNWFQPGDAKRGSGEALSIRQMIETMVVTHGLDRRRIFITGLSAGGAMAAAMLATYPEVFASGAIIAGLPYGSATTIPEAFDRMRGHGGPSEQDLQRTLRGASNHQGPWPRISIWHGAADHTVSPSNAEAIAGQWRGVHRLEKAPTHREVAGSHGKQVWRNGAGEALIEINMIAGMGHGTPLGIGLGAPGPYMIDVGISSTREIAQFWGIAATEESASRKSRPQVPTSHRPLPQSPAPGIENAKAKPPQPTAIHQFPRHTELGQPGVKKIIEDALRSAGLMR